MDKRRVVTDIMTIALVAAMVGVAELLGENFPGDNGASYWCMDRPSASMAY